MVVHQDGNATGASGGTRAWFLDVHIDFKFEIIPGVGGPCRTEMWEYTNAEVPTTDVYDYPTDSLQPYIVPDVWSEVMNAESVGGVSAIADAYTQTVADSDCPSTSHSEHVDPVRQYRPFYLFQSYRQTSGCPDGSDDENNDWIIVDASGHLTRWPSGTEIANHVTPWPGGPSTPSPMPPAPPSYWSRAADGMQTHGPHLGPH